MGKGTAIVIGVSDGDAIKHYGLTKLPHAEGFARDVAAFATALGYQSVTTLLGPRATHSNVETAIRSAATAQPAWDTVLIVFSGHGYQKNSGQRCEDGSRDDEHWCLHDELMVDDHLLMLTQKFASTTRVFIVADCCHAALGSGLTGQPLETLMRRASELLPSLVAWLDPRSGDVDAGREALRRKEPTFNCAPPTAQVLFLGASGSGKSEPGKFTDAFLKAWNAPSARSSFRAFYEKVAAFGGKPVVLPPASPLLNAPAFDP